MPNNVPKPAMVMVADGNTIFLRGNWWKFYCGTRYPSSQESFTRPHPFFIH